MTNGEMAPKLLDFARGSAGPAPGRRTPKLWQMIALAIGVHVVVLLLTSTGLFSSRGESAEEIYARGEALMSQGHYVEAMEAFQRVMDQQPKPPPIFEKAAQQHRAADRLAKQPAAPAPRVGPKESTADAGQASGRPATEPSRPPGGGATSTPALSPPAEDFVPPELRGK